MSQNTLKVHDLNEDAEFDENGVEAFDEKALSEEEPSDNDLAEEELLSQGATQRVLDATQLYLGEIGYSPLLTAEEEVYFARRALRGDVASRRRMIESNLRLVVKIARRYGNHRNGNRRMRRGAGRMRPCPTFMSTMRPYSRGRG